MSSSPDSPLARAFAALEATMQSGTGRPVDPDRRRAAYRLGELVRTGEEDLGQFAKKHLPGREVPSDALTQARELATHLDKLVGLLGRSPDADATVARFATELAALLPSLLEAATPIAPPALPVEVSPPPEAKASVAPRELAAPPEVPLAPPPALPLIDAAPPSVGPPSSTLDETPEPTELPAALPFTKGNATAATSEFPAFQLEGELPVALPFGQSKAGAPPSRTRAPLDDNRVMPFRRNRQAPPSGPGPDSVLPEHLRGLDVETYATLRVLLELFPARRDELFRHYGIADGRSCDLLDAHWNLRITSDAALGATWRATYARTLEHYRNRP